jgi:phosphopantothenate---cysteine ligase (ATP)
MAASNATDDATESAYFSSHPPPKTLKNHEALARAFISLQVESGRRVVLVTSGGTQVPLEQQTVRYIDNFSAGTRGACSAEYFLESGYAVIFLHRQFSLLPYSRHYSHSTNCFLDFMEEEGEEEQEDVNIGEDTNDNDKNKNRNRNKKEAFQETKLDRRQKASGGNIKVRQEYQWAMREVLRKYRYAKQNNMLLLLSFTTVTEYIWELRSLANLMRPLGSRALFYLAAAVSDFFIPPNRMAEHKIQSSEIPTEVFGDENDEKNKPINRAAEAEADEEKEMNIYTGYNDPNHPNAKKLVIDLDPIPKFLHRLVDGWAPQGSMIVSFKLETDPNLLVYKAKTSLQRYSHHLVIGNLLSTRKWEVVFVTPDEEERWIRVPKSRRSKSISGVEDQVGMAERRVAVCFWILLIST